MRCGDILGDWHPPVYRLACDHCFAGITDWIGNTSHALLIAAGHNGAQYASRCESAINHYTKVISKFIPHVSVQKSNTAAEDWHLMHAADKVVAIIPSSFSFSSKVGHLDQLKILGPHGAPWFHPCGSVEPRAWTNEFENTLRTCT